MNKKTKLLLAGLIIGLAGIAVIIGIAIGTDAIMSRESTKTYSFDKPFDTLALPQDPDICPTEVDMLTGDYRVEAFIKAWRPEHIDIDKMLSIEVKEGTLYIKMNKFPDDFLGMFPQPYELKITVYTPLGDDLKEIWY